MNKEALASTAIAVGLVATVCASSIMAVDYFADGCMVGDRYYVTTEVSPGVSISEVRTKSICRQVIIRTKRGDERRNVDY